MHKCSHHQIPIQLRELKKHKPSLKMITNCIFAQNLRKIEALALAVSWTFCVLAVLKFNFLVSLWKMLIVPWGETCYGCVWGKFSAYLSLRWLYITSKTEWTWLFSCQFLFNYPWWFHTGKLLTWICWLPSVITCSLPFNLFLQ